MFTKTDIEKYFISEKQAGLIFLVLGIIAIIIAIFFLIIVKTNFFKGASIPLLITGALFALAGFAIFKRSDEDLMRNVYAYDMNPSELNNRELPRMKMVIRRFVIYRWVEFFLLIAGAGLYIYFIRDMKNDFCRGFGLALAFLSLIALAADYFAEKRAKIFTRGLESFVTQS